MFEDKLWINIMCVFVCIFIMDGRTKQIAVYFKDQKGKPQKSTRTEC